MSDIEHGQSIDRREAIKRVGVMLGGVAFVGGTNLLVACEKAGTPARDSAAATGTGPFTTQDVALLDEIAETILPQTKTPGAKAAKTGAFMALMVTDSYSPADQRIFRDGMRQLDQVTQQAHKVGFMAATPAQRLAVLTQLDREQKRDMDARDAAVRAKKGLPPVPIPAEAGVAGKEGDAYLSDQRQENAATGKTNPAPAITADSPTHYFRMMKELALLGYFTSEIGYTQAQRYEETPGRWEPCAPYTKGEPAWAPHA
ncbi:MAG: twin-arginine translocation pathway signal protein [Gemmatimonadetes bacterium]|nr:MAG: twin-arginine translocation pathway signal protein [Gemmatimonadota bacterium]